jgi:tetratricopeptide (TPR) repeat protein
MMKKVTYLLMALLAVSCQRSSNTNAEERENLFEPMIQDEIVYVTKNMEGLRKDFGKEWYEGDSVFYTNWMMGAKEELAGNFKKAVVFYVKALNTKRYEISSYEVKLSLGRAYFETGDKEKARKMLLEFKKEAQKDLSGDEVEWGLTDEAKEALTHDIEDCDYLLSMIEPGK